MAMELPDWLRTALEYIGYDWPATNEDTLNGWSGELSTFASTLQTQIDDLNGAIDHVHNTNEGPGIKAFIASARGDDSNVDALENFKKACDLASTGCSVCATIVVTMKGAVIAQLIIMAASLASGPGALLVKQGVKWAVEAAINVVVDRVLNGVGE